MQETKKAFRKLPNLEQALTALSNLKGVGITMASALLAAAAPDSAPFMADECKFSIWFMIERLLWRMSFILGFLLFCFLTDSI